MEKHVYYTCQEIIDRHVSVNLLGWNVAKVGTFYNCLLLDGKRFGNKRTRVMVTDESFNKLLSYAMNLHGTPEQQPIYMSYDEVMENFPQVHFFHWSPTVIGIFYHSGLLCGKRSKKEGRYLVTEQSVINLIKYTCYRFIEIADAPQMRKGA